MNLSMMMGRLVKDPKVKHTENEDGPLTVAYFRIAVDRIFSGKDKHVTTDYFNCTAFGWLAEFTDKYLYQGIKIIVSGQMRNNNYTNEDGDKVYGVNLLLNDIEFAESKAASQRNNDSDKSRDNRDNQNGRNSKSNRNSNRQQDENAKKASRKSSERPRERQESNDRRGEYRNTKERSRTHREDLDEEFRDMDECDEEYDFN